MNSSSSASKGAANSPSDVANGYKLDRQTARSAKHTRKDLCLSLERYEDASINDIYVIIGAIVVLLIVTVAIVLVIKRCRQYFKNDEDKPRCMCVKSKRNTANVFLFF